MPTQCHPGRRVCKSIFLNHFDAHRQGKQMKNKQQQSTCDVGPMQQGNANATPPFLNF